MEDGRRITLRRTDCRAGLKGFASSAGHRDRLSIDPGSFGKAGLSENYGAGGGSIMAESGLREEKKASNYVSHKLGEKPKAGLLKKKGAERVYLKKKKHTKG